LYTWLKTGIGMLLATLSAAGTGTVATQPRCIHIIVALCDNKHQGIVPVPAHLGNGDKPETNLYWGAMFGVKTFFSRHRDWRLVAEIQPASPLLARCVFKHSRLDAYIVADAYQGREIRRAVSDFLSAAGGAKTSSVSFTSEETTVTLPILGGADMLVYAGHNGLMDFTLPTCNTARDGERQVVILACYSKTYFKDHVAAAGAAPLLWTTGLMAPEAYTIAAAVEGWLAGETAENIRLRAARAYNHYQKCGSKAAKRLFASGF